MRPHDETSPVTGARHMHMSRTRAPGLGLGTIVHWEPFQCSISVCDSPPKYVALSPTAHISAAELALIARSVSHGCHCWRGRLTQRAPSQWRMYALLVVLCCASCVRYEPTVHMSLAFTASIAANVTCAEPSASAGSRSAETADQRPPLPARIR